MSQKRPFNLNNYYVILTVVVYLQLIQIIFAMQDSSQKLLECI